MIMRLIARVLRWTGYQWGLGVQTGAIEAHRSAATVDRLIKPAAK